MRETLLMKLALGCILLGLPSLYIISDLFHIDEVAGKIEGTARESTVEGKITDLRISERGTTLKIVSYSTIFVSDAIEIPVNSTIIAKGRTQNRTLIANEVRVT